MESTRALSTKSPVFWSTVNLDSLTDAQAGAVIHKLHLFRAEYGNLLPDHLRTQCDAKLESMSVDGGGDAPYCSMFFMSVSRVRRLLFRRPRRATKKKASDDDK